MSTPNRIQIIGTPRSGTTYLFATIGRYHNYVYPDSVFYAEPFNAHAQAQPFKTKFDSTFQLARYPETFKDVCAEINTRAYDILSQPYCVVKNHVSHLPILGLSYTADFQQQFKDFFDYNIAIVREDVFDCAMSLAVSMITKEWVHYDKTRTEQFMVPLPMFQHCWEMITKSNRDIITNVNHIKYDEFKTYEQLDFWARKDWSDLKFNAGIDIDSLPKVKSPVELSPPKRQVVLNYDDLYAYTLNTLIPNTPQDIFTFVDTKMTNIKVNMN